MNDLCAGVDEVGNGSLAGPLCIAVVVFPQDFPMIEGVNDSKQLSRTKREHLAPIIVEKATFVGIGWASPRFIDEHGMVESWQAAAGEALYCMPEVSKLWIDGNRRVDNFVGNQETMIKGDCNPMVWWIGAASIVAKVARDATMRELAKTWIHYGWDSNVGYASRVHWAGLKKYGVTPLHRRLFLRKSGLV